MGDRGFLMLEWVLVISMLSLFIGSSILGGVQALEVLRLRGEARQLVVVLYALQREALASGEDRWMEMSGDGGLQGWGAGGALDLSWMPADEVSVAMNRSKIGFSETGRSAYSGRFELRLGQHLRQVSVGVGFGQIRIK